MQQQIKKKKLSGDGRLAYAMLKKKSILNILSILFISHHVPVLCEKHSVH